MCFCTYLLSEDSKDTYDVQVMPGTGISPFQATSPYVFYALFARFLTEDVLDVGHHTIRHVDQGATEDGMQFSQPLLDANT